MRSTTFWLPIHHLQVDFRGLSSATCYEAEVVFAAGGLVSNPAYATFSTAPLPSATAAVRGEARVHGSGNDRGSDCCAIDKGNDCAIDNGNDCDHNIGNNCGSNCGNGCGNNFSVVTLEVVTTVAMIVAIVSVMLDYVCDSW